METLNSPLKLCKKQNEDWSMFRKQAASGIEIYSWEEEERLIPGTGINKEGEGKNRVHLKSTDKSRRRKTGSLSQGEC